MTYKRTNHFKEMLENLEKNSDKINNDIKNDIYLKNAFEYVIKDIKINNLNIDLMTDDCYKSILKKSNNIKYYEYIYIIKKILENCNGKLKLSEADIIWLKICEELGW